ncbi:hypothetical protein FIBSPDRAFT_891395 [Athelia psychrophila]|uniref:Uncharacterized protein n=1 Tax=Athelia psychrophila TaxID=1759441 RepID=A0A166JV81_9AGAM|nr:hypothetical protein FIBSPDRAFT_891395 [Fibularhizoctonia sp. CBS 109695]
MSHSTMNSTLKQKPSSDIASHLAKWFYYIGLNGDQFSLFPVWVQSNRFTSREEVMCHFASPNTDRKIRALNVGLICMLLEDHPKSLELNSDLNVTQALSLLDMAGQIVVQSVELDVLHLNWSLTAPELNGCHCHPLLLQAITAPKLKALTLSGGIPWGALVLFLARHTTISEINLPASDITHLPRIHHTLQMPQLHRLEGKLANINSLLKILTNSTITLIQGEIPRNTSICLPTETKISKTVSIRSQLSQVSKCTI